MLLIGVFFLIIINNQIDSFYYNLNIEVPLSSKYLLTYPFIFEKHERENKYSGAQHSPNSSWSLTMVKILIFHSPFPLLSEKQHTKIIYFS
jgi:hypothetical protein